MQGFSLKVKMDGRFAAQFIGRLVLWIVDHQFYMTVFVAPLLLFPGYFPYGLAFIAWGIIALPWIYRLIVHNRRFFANPVDMPVTTMCIILAVSIWFSVDQQRSMGAVSQIIIGVNILYGLIRVSYVQMNVWVPVISWFIAIVSLAVVAPFLVNWSSASHFLLDEVYGRLTPVFAESLDPNILAGMLSMTLLMLGALIWQGIDIELHSCMSRIGSNVVLWITTLTLLAALVFTQSRGAIAGFVLGWLGLATLYNRKIALFTVVAGCAVGIVIWSILASTVSDLPFSHLLAGWIGRRETWSHAIEMLEQRPIIGIGVGAYLTMLAVLHPYSYAWPIRPTHAHNLFLQVGVDLGIPGLVAYVGIVTSCLIMAFQAWHTFRRAGERNLEALSAGVFAALIAMITHGLVDAPLWGTKPSVVAWYFMGLAAMLFVHSQRGFKTSEDSNAASRTG